MSDTIELAAQLRTNVGKGASRRLRRDADLVPAVMYGAEKDAVNLSLLHKDLHKACESESFFTQIINIRTGNELTPAIIKDLQRHPARDRIMHADFFRVSMDEEIEVEVPIHFINEEECVGVKLHHGQITHNISSVEIACLPGDLPEFIEVDMLNMNVGDDIHMSKLVLPAGVRIPALDHDDAHEHDQVVASVVEQRVEASEEEKGDDDGAPAADAKPAPEDD